MGPRSRRHAAQPGTGAAPASPARILTHAARGRCAGSGGAPAQHRPGSRASGFRFPVRMSSRRRLLKHQYKTSLRSNINSWRKRRKVILSTRLSIHKERPARQAGGAECSLHPAHQAQPGEGRDRQGPGGSNPHGGARLSCRHRKSKCLNKLRGSCQSCFL